MAKVIATDNYDRGIYADTVLEENLPPEEAEAMASSMNAMYSNLHPHYYKAVPDDYKLFVPEE